MKTLDGRTAVITGAASGIGRALALALARAGCQLALVDIQEGVLAEVAAEAESLGATVSVHVVDVSQRAQVLALPEAVIRAHSAAHLLINNAGVTVMKSFLDHDQADMEWITGINLWGVLYGCHAFLPHMLDLDEAHIVNISSIFGIIGVPGQTLYSATKFAVRGLSEALAEELHDHTNIRVSVVHPGGVNTGIITSSRGEDAERDRVAAFFARKTLSADAAADQIIVGIRKNQQRILITREAPVLDRLKRLMPVRGNRMAVNMLLRAMGFTRDELVGARLDARSAGDGG